MKRTNKVLAVVNIILIILGILFMTTGCEETVAKSEVNYFKNGINIEVIVDKDTCVEYLSYYKRGLSPLYNADGSLKLNKQCINDNN